MTYKPFIASWDKCTNQLFGCEAGGKERQEEVRESKRPKPRPWNLQKFEGPTDSVEKVKLRRGEERKLSSLYLSPTY